MQPRVFISMTGPDGNLGDVFIRRVVLDWVRTDNGVVAFVGRHPQDWVDAMQFTDTDTIVRGGTKRRMLWLLTTAFSRSRPILVTDPGETWVGRNRLLHHILHLAVGLVVKARGGAIIIPPHALAQQKAAPISPITLDIHRRFARIADMCLWREPWSYGIAGTGDLVPDIAMADEPRSGAPDHLRRLCVVSQRGDRPPFSKPVLDAIVALAVESRLELVSLAQVDADQERARENARIMKSQCVSWDPADAESEERLRDVFDQASLVISDRLHVLIFGLLSGAMPAELAPFPERKIASHLGVIGLADISLDVEGRSKDEIASWLRVQLSRRDEAKAAAQNAHAQLGSPRARVLEILTAARSHRD